MEISRSFLVVDEAHYIKQIEGKWAKAVLSLAPDAKYRCILTGTPSPHSYLVFLTCLISYFQKAHPYTQIHEIESNF